jgi:PTS system nitrogen regulatory IIA component
MMKKENGEKSLAELIERGGVLYNVLGNSPQEILTGIINTVPVPLSIDNALSIDKGGLLKAVLEREALMSTGIGKGIALPHPRNPVIRDGEQQFVTIAFPARPVDWNALDGKPVHTIMLIAAASAKEHLHILSKLNFLSQQENFYHLLRAGASRDEITGFIREAERAWQKE